MGLREDIAAIRADPSLAPDEARRRASRMKADAALAALSAPGQDQFTVDGTTITLTRPPTVDRHGRLVVWVSAVRGGQAVNFGRRGLPLIFVNPPVGGDTLATVQRMVADAVGRFQS